MHLETKAAPTPDTSGHVNWVAKPTDGSFVRMTAGALNSAGTLAWGVKDTFLRYVSELPDGVCEVSSQILLPGNGRFGFPMTTSAGSPPTKFRFAGNVTFSAHGGFLFVSLSELALECIDGVWLLTCRDPENPTVRLNLATGTHVRTGSDPHAVHISVVLTPEGSELFRGNYPAGEPLSDLVLNLPNPSQSQHNTHES